MSDLLKVRVGGSSYLCKWMEPIRTWSLDIPNLILENRTDEDGIVYTFNHISKIDDNAKLKGEGNYSLGVGFGALGIIKEVYMTIDSQNKPSYGQYTYSGPCLAQFRSAGHITKYGTWLGCNTNGNRWTHIVGQYKQNYNSDGVYWECYDNIDITFPLVQRLSFDDDGLVRLYYNDVLIAYKTNDYDIYPYWHASMNSGGQTSSQPTILSDLTVKYIPT